MLSSTYSKVNLGLFDIDSDGTFEFLNSDRTIRATPSFTDWQDGYPVDGGGTCVQTTS
jgi:hypothetical protein